MIFGYFDAPEQTEPTRDPGLEVECPFCNRKLQRPVMTISLALDGDTRSYFYRVHKGCYEQADINTIETVESGLIDAIALESGYSQENRVNR